MDSSTGVLLVPPSPEAKKRESVVSDRMAGTPPPVSPSICHCGKGYLLFPSVPVRLEQQSVGLS